MPIVSFHALRRLAVAMLVLVLAAPIARAQEDRDYTRVIGRPEMLSYVADVAVALNKEVHRKFPQIEQSSTEGAQRTFCTTLRDSPDVMIIPLARGAEASSICRNDEPLLALPFGRQVIMLYTAPGAPRFALTLEQLFRALARELPKPGSVGAEVTFEPNPNKRWRDISSDLPDIPIRILGPPRRALQWLTLEDLVMRPACLALPPVAALAQIDPQSAERHCLSRRFDSVMSYANGEKYAVTPEIVPTGTELAINERRAMQLMKIAVPQPVDGVVPDTASLDAGSYPLARPIVAVAKVNRVDTIPNLRSFLVEITSQEASGERGYLTKNGMDPLPPEALKQSALKAQFARPVKLSERKAQAEANEAGKK